MDHLAADDVPEAEGGREADDVPAADDVPEADPALARRSYGSGQLTEAELAPTWLEQLRRWYAQAVAAPGSYEPNALQVATVDLDGLPDVRTVLARGFDESGVVFYTNYDSSKGQQLTARPFAAAVFGWLALERQVRLRGPVSRVSAAETAAYFASRPRDSQLGAWASPQSQVIAGREELESRLREVSEQFGDGPIPLPPFWGGFRIQVIEAEFWQGRESRLHDRLRYRQDRLSGKWLIERLAP
ncbi:MAG: pyridoxamine 5-phosphate oxidase [Pseudonocardiales bacterium]|nr:pyridoxamine 5-phosphate oxidase [Pseudonocardiales bacterium]